MTPEAKARLVQSGFGEEAKNLTLEDVKEMLCAKFDTIDLETAKKCCTFQQRCGVFKISSTDFFKSIIKKLKDNKQS